MRFFLLAALAALILAAPAGSAIGGPTLLVTFTATKILVNGNDLASDQPVGLSFHYQPADSPFGRSGTLNLADGQVQPGIDTTDVGTFGTSIRRAFLGATGPGELTVTDWQGTDSFATTTVEVPG